MESERKTAWIKNKSIGKDLWCPNYGGSFSAFTTRPWPKQIILYCVGDVEFLLELYSRFWPKASDRWKAKVELATKAAIEES
jgi:exonuclease 3'-5' domain-containing protein 1